MNDSEITNVMRAVDLEFGTSSMDDLNLARQYILRNPHLINDYPSLESALKLLQLVIEHEEVDSLRRNARQTI